MFRIRRNLVFIILLLVFTALTGCGGQNSGNSLDGDDMAEKAGYTDITPEDAKKRLDSDEKLVLLDVRTQEEYDASHIEDSVLIPVDELEERAAEILADKDTPVLIYCRSGNRSVTAANILVELGYTNVYNLGGIIDWPYGVVQ